MGESRKNALRLNFDRKLKLEFHEVKVTSDAALLAYRQLHEALGLTGNSERNVEPCTQRQEDPWHLS